MKRAGLSCGSRRAAGPAGDAGSAASGNAHPCSFLDSMLVFTTVRTVAVQDRSLGVLNLCAKFIIFCYIIVYSIILKQGYRGVASHASNVLILPGPPPPHYRWDDQRAPYCYGTNASNFAPPGQGVNAGVDADRAARYSFIAAGGAGAATTPPMYAFDGGAPSPQLPCQYVDGVLMQEQPLDTNSAFVPTLKISLVDALSPLPECATLAHSYCKWTRTSSKQVYVADAESVPITITHAFTSASGISGNGLILSGALLDANGDVMDACAAYARARVPCNATYAAVGVAGFFDAIPLGTLLAASGTSGLDAPASSSSDSPLKGSLRQNGVVLLVQLHYTNAFLGDAFSSHGTGTFDPSVVRYYYKVTRVTDKGFFAQDVGPLTFPASVRTHDVKFGARIIISTSANVNSFNFLSLILNLTASLALLALSNAITNFAMANCCRLSAVYKQFGQISSPNFNAWGLQKVAAAARAFGSGGGGAKLERFEALEGLEADEDASPEADEGGDIELAETAETDGDDTTAVPAAEEDGAAIDVDAANEAAESPSSPVADGTADAADNAVGFQEEPAAVEVATPATETRERGGARRWGY